MRFQPRSPTPVPTRLKPHVRVLYTRFFRFSASYRIIPRQICDRMSGVKSPFHSIAIAIAAFPIALCAQWPNYPTPGVPRTADGKPDLSGVWDTAYRGGIGRARNTGGPPPVVGVGPPPPPPPPSPPGTPPPATFFNIGAGFKDGLPLKPWAAALLKKRMSENSRDNPDAHCLPMGLMQLHEHPQPRKIVQTPNVIVIMYEGNSGLRQIFTDGRPLPPKDVEPWWYGYSVGHWDGDTLVVETTGFRDDVWLDVNGSPMTNAGKLTEKFRRVNYGNLEIEVTVDDPSAYTKPFTVKVYQRLMLDTDLIEFICAENEKSDAHLVAK